MIATRRRKKMRTRRRRDRQGEDNYEKDRQNDIDEAKRQGEEMS